MILNQEKISSINNSIKRKNKKQLISNAFQNMEEEDEEQPTIRKLRMILDFPGQSPEDNIEELIKEKTFPSETRMKILKKDFQFSQSPNKSMDLNSKSFHFQNSINTSFPLNNRGRSQGNKKTENGFKKPFSKEQVFRKLKKKFRKDIFNKRKKKLGIPKSKGKFNGYYNFNLPDSFNNGENLWLLKVASYNRGFGIELFKNLNSFFKHLFNFWFGYEEHINEKNKSNKGN
jgi:hypothetical protein